MSRIVRQEPRQARSWRVVRSWQRELRELYGLFNGSTILVVSVVVWTSGAGESVVVVVSAMAVDNGCDDSRRRVIAACGF